jgi:hypothetical protein
MAQLLEMNGLSFGRLTVRERVEDHVTPAGSRHAKYACTCECGGVIETLGSTLRRGKATSCGCFRREDSSARVHVMQAAGAKARTKDIVEYGGAHRRVYRLRGQATGHPCVDCGLPADDWSYNHDDPDELISKERAGVAYSLKPEHYSPRCKSHHNQLDHRPKEAIA